MSKASQKMIPRNRILKSLRSLAKLFPCIAIIGPRQVGKTSLLQQLFPEGKSSFFDLERQADFTRVQQDPEFFLHQFEKQPILLDEAQECPPLFRALRVEIDRKRTKKGRFFVSGSSSPELLKNLDETLAGRVGVFELSGLSLEEAFEAPETPLYEAIQNQEWAKKRSSSPPSWFKKPRFSKDQLFTHCLSGGYPEAFLLKAREKQKKKNQSPNDFSLWMENYFRSYVDRDIRRLFPQLDIKRYQTLVTLLAKTSGQILNFSHFARSLDVSVPTIQSYMRIAEGTFLWRRMDSYHKNAVKRVSKLPKGYLRDSGLIQFISRNQTVADFLSHPEAGFIWEAYLVEEILKNFKNRLISVQPYYYRTHAGEEVDLILEGNFGLLPIEIKLGSHTDSKQLNSLQNWILEKKVPYGIVINLADQPCWLTPQILQIPATFL